MKKSVLWSLFAVLFLGLSGCVSTPKNLANKVTDKGAEVVNKVKEEVAENKKEEKGEVKEENKKEGEKEEAKKDDNAEQGTPNEEAGESDAEKKAEGDEKEDEGKDEGKGENMKDEKGEDENMDDNTGDTGDKAAAKKDTGKSYSLDDVAQHAVPDDCWFVIDGKVYDVTPFINSGKHPGGPALLEGCGRDATELFKTRPMGSGTPHSPKAQAALEKFEIGVLSK